MASKNDDFQDRYYDLLQDTLSDLGKKIDRNTKHTLEVKTQAQETNGRVLAAEKRLDKLDTEVFGKIKPSDLPKWYRDPKIISIIFNITLILLLLVAAATRVDVGKLLP